MVTSYSQPCQGQVTILSWSDPSPSGPPLCRQVLLIAKNLPPTLASATALPADLKFVNCANGYVGNLGG